MKKFKLKKQYKNILVSILSVFILVIGGVALINSRDTKAATCTVGWYKDNTGWYYYYNTSCSYYHGHAQVINGKYYYFNDEGYMETDRILDWNGKTILLDENGARLSRAWTKIDGDWYYANSVGVMQTDKTIDGYELDEDGRCVSDNCDDNTDTQDSDSSDELNKCQENCTANHTGEDLISCQKKCESNASSLVVVGVGPGESTGNGGSVNTTETNSGTTGTTTSNVTSTTTSSSSKCENGYTLLRDGSSDHTYRATGCGEQYELFCLNEGKSSFAPNTRLYFCNMDNYPANNTLAFGLGSQAITKKAAEIYGTNQVEGSNYATIRDALRLWNHLYGNYRGVNSWYHGEIYNVNGLNASNVDTFGFKNLYDAVSNNPAQLRVLLNAAFSAVEAGGDLNSTDGGIEITHDEDDEKVTEERNSNYKASLEYKIEGLDLLKSSDGTATFKSLTVPDEITCTSSIENGTKLVENGKVVGSDKVTITCEGTAEDLIEYLSEDASEEVKFVISWSDSAYKSTAGVYYTSNDPKCGAPSKQIYYAVFSTLNTNGTPGEQETEQIVYLESLDNSCEISSDGSYNVGPFKNVSLEAFLKAGCCSTVNTDNLNKSEVETYVTVCKPKTCDNNICSEENKNSSSVIKDWCDNNCYNCEQTPIDKDKFDKNDCCEELDPDSPAYIEAGCVKCEATVEYPDANVCDSSKPEAERETYIKESNNFNTCIIDKKDESGNSYNVATDIVADDNPYCAVSCKEDYNFFLPTSRFGVKQGTYFFLNAGITGTRTCVVGNSNNKTTTAAIDKTQFEKDVADLNAKIANAYAKYLTAKSIEDNGVDESTGSCDCDENGRNCDTRYRYKLSYTVSSNRNNTSYSSSNTSVSDSNCGSSMSDDEIRSQAYSKSTDGHDSSYWNTEYTKLKEELNSKVAMYNQCTNWTDKVEYTFDPKIDYTYDESTYMAMVWGTYTRASFEKTQVKTINGAYVNTKEDPGEITADNTIATTVEYSTTVADGANGYTLTNASSSDSKNWNVRTVSSCDSNGCTYADNMMSSNISVKKTQTASAIYKPEAVFYTLSPNGSAQTAKPSDEQTYTEIGRVFPVALTTTPGNYEYKLGFYDIGVKQDQTLGRIVALTNPSTSGGFGQYSLYGNVKDQFIHSCGYEVIQDVCDKCDTYSCAAINGVIPENCKADYEAKTGADFLFSFRSTTNGNLFPNSGLSYIEIKNGTDKVLGESNNTNVLKTAKSNEPTITEAADKFGTETDENSYRQRITSEASSEAGKLELDVNNIGSNWSTLKGLKTIEEIQRKADSIYEDTPDYSFTLSPSQMKNLRNITDDFYSTFDNYYNNDSSKRDNGENSYSVFLSNMLRDSSYNNGDYYTWNESKFQTDEISTIFTPYEQVVAGQGPAWK